ncbi:response regulator [Chryseolinea sp. H1M3-3]|uniref:response regulator n=1 Tax=Chryseolinea sp. H1M3-3 TaxID=3034144 RepID=UPI0023EC15D1|nr:response regulator [Chryseolinea sp. H1M3-3]
MEKKLFISDPIVIVEDDADDQYFIRMLCEKLGVTSELLFFDDGVKALHYLQTTQKKIFLILSDINMPMMNGLELRRRIQADETLRKKSIPFIFLSTAARQKDVDEAYDLTVQGFFVKASQLSEMEATLELILRYWAKCKHPNSF